MCEQRGRRCEQRVTLFASVLRWNAGFRKARYLLAKNASFTCVSSRRLYMCGLVSSLPSVRTTWANLASLVPQGIENEGGELLCEGNFMTERDLGTLTLFPEVCKLFGHDNDILVIAAARSHGQFASACRARDVAEACIRLWDFDGGVAGEFTGGHKSSVVCLEFTEDERFLASSGKDRRICVWDREKRELVAAVDNAHKRIVWGLSWHDGVLLSGGRDGAVKLWRVEGDGLVCVHEVAFKGESVTSVHFKPTPGFVFAAGFESGRVKVVVWVEGGQGEEVTELLDRHGAQVRSVKWRPDGEAVLASCGDDHAVKVHLVE